MSLYVNMWLVSSKSGKLKVELPSAASSDSSKWQRIRSVLVIAVFIGCVVHQLLKLCGQPPRKVYSSFHNPERSTEEVSQHIRALEHQFSTIDGWNPSTARAAVQDVIRLGNCGASRQGKKHRSMICTIVRNDLHLREFLVRNLIQGFCHIVVYDNNQIGAGMDHSIRLLLEPFMAEGVVTHVPFLQNDRHFLHNKQKDQHALECVNKYGSRADWVTIMDSDEYFYITKQPTAAAPTSSNRSISSTDSPQMIASPSDIPSSKDNNSSNSSEASAGVLNSFLTDVETSGLDACALKFPWRMLYGEHKVLRSDKLLMDTYTHVCESHKESKVLFRPERSIPKPPHSAECRHRHSRRVSIDSDSFQDLLPQYSVKLLHYYSRSLEEYLIKSEQSMPPYVRLMKDSYDTVTDCSWLDYLQQYTTAVHDSMQRLQTAQGGLPDSGITLAASPEWQPMGRPDYALYIFLKLRVQQRQEWDESAYLLHNPAAAKLVAQGKYVDGLHHFLVSGFYQGLSSCWVHETDAEKVCIA